MQYESLTTRYLVVGRHDIQFPDDGHTYQVVATQPVLFPQDVAGCRTTLLRLITEASRQDAAVLLQAIPSQVTRAILDLRRTYCNPDDPHDGLGIDAIVSLPQPREAGIEITFDPQSVITGRLKPRDRQAISELFQQQISQINRNAKIQNTSGITRGTVDPTPKFKPLTILHF